MSDTFPYQLKTVTISGADDSVDPLHLLALSKKYPFVEWGILLSKSAQGRDRYPTLEWLKKLRAVIAINDIDVRLSGHMCGRWARDICIGDWSYIDDHGSVFTMFNRFQLNISTYMHKVNAFFIPELSEIGKQIIIQVKDFNNEILADAKKAGVDAVPLFDRSGGRGVVPEEWPRANSEMSISGYAGGLSPINVQREVRRILMESNDINTPIWIDMESGVRTDNKFDMDKVKQVLEYLAPLVSEV